MSTLEKNYVKQNPRKSSTKKHSSKEGLWHLWYCPNGLLGLAGRRLLRLAHRCPALATVLNVDRLRAALVDAVAPRLQLGPQRRVYFVDPAALRDNCSRSRSWATASCCPPAESSRRRRAWAGMVTQSSELSSWKGSRKTYSQVIWLMATA